MHSHQPHRASQDSQLKRQVRKMPHPLLFFHLPRMEKSRQTRFDDRCFFSARPAPYRLSGASILFQALSLSMKRPGQMEMTILSNRKQQTRPLIHGSQIEYANALTLSFAAALRLDCLQCFVRMHSTRRYRVRLSTRRLQHMSKPVSDGRF